MSQYYIYLISSLPMLQFGARPPFSFARFLAICADKIPQGDMNILQTASISGDYTGADTGPFALKKWQQLDSALRNELARIRAARQHIDPLKYLRRDGFSDPAIAHIAASAGKNPSMIEAERALDQARWRMLDELSLGHYFDLDFLIIYAHQLLILERWEKIRAANSALMLEAALD